MRWYIPVVFLAAVALLSFAYLSKLFRNPIFKYERSGGIAGFVEEFTVYDDGKISYRDLKAGTEMEVDLGEALLNLMRLLREELSKAPPVNVKARPGAADFFAHKLNVAGKDFEWVDEWAADGELPGYILDFQRLISAVISDKVKGSFVGYGVSSHKNDVGLEVGLASYLCRKKEPVNIRIVVRNTGDRDIVYTSPTPCHPDVLLNSDIECELEFVKPRFSNETICVQVIDRRQLGAGASVENLAVITFKDSGIAHLTVRFPLATFEQEVAVVTVPVFVSD
jgi:hypothetical protein